MNLRIAAAVSALAMIIGTGCDSDDIDSDTEARWGYLGFDRAIDRGINLGFDGYNAADNANIPAQVGDGDVAGTMTVSGKVDQGVSSNKEMDLSLALVDYDDGTFDDITTDDVEELVVVYDTDEATLPLLDLSLRNVPNGTFTGTLTGTFLLSGDVGGEAEFALTLSGDLQEDPDNPGDVIRAPGTLVITGTVTSGDGVYDVDVQR